MYQDKKRHDSDSVKIAQKAGETANFSKTKTSKPKRPKTKPNFPAWGDFFFDFFHSIHSVQFLNTMPNLTKPDFQNTAAFTSLTKWRD
nr:hypothetical protein [Bacillus pumilus]